MTLLIKFLKRISRITLYPSIAKIISLLSFKYLSIIDVYRLEYKWYRKVTALIQKICSHPSSYNTAGWSGAFRHCTICNKQLEVLYRAITNQKTMERTYEANVSKKL